MIPALRKETYHDPKGIMLRFYGRKQCHFDKDYVFDFSDFNDCEDAWTEIKKRIENQRWTAQDAKDIALKYLRYDFIKYYQEWAQNHYSERVDNE